MDPGTPATDAAPADEADARDDDGRFRPGVSGNPRGRPLGSRRALHLARALVEAGIVAVVLTERPGTVRPAPAARRPRRPAA